MLSRVGFFSVPVWNKFTFLVTLKEDVFEVRVGIKEKLQKCLL